MLSISVIVMWAMLAALALCALLWPLARFYGERVESITGAVDEHTLAWTEVYSR